MPPGAIYSYCLGDKDELELIDAVYVQPHETEHTSQDMVFENSCYEQSFIRTDDQRNNANQYNLEDTTIHPCKKKSKLDDKMDALMDNLDEFVEDFDSMSKMKPDKERIESNMKAMQESLNGI